MTATLAAGAQRRHDLAAALLLLLLPLALLWPSLLGNHVFLPFDPAQWPPAATPLDDAELHRMREGQNGEVTETPLVFAQELRFTQQELAEGRLPEWNPFARLGAPLLATSVVGLLYPPNWLLLVLGDPVHGLALAAWLAYALAGLLAYGFLRELRLQPLAALLGAIAFAVGGTMAANAHFYQRFAALLWLPGMLWALLRLAHTQGRGRIPALVSLTLCVALAWLAGFPPFAAAATLVAGLYAATLLWREWRRAGPAPALRLGAAAAGAFAAGFLIAAVQLLPMFAFFPESNRDTSPGPDAIAAVSLDWFALLGYALPSPFGDPSAHALDGAYSPLTWWLGGRDSWVDGRPFAPNYVFTEYAVFPGTLVLLLAAVGALRARTRFRTFALTAFALLLLLALAPSWLAFLWRVPGIANVPPMRFVGPASLLLAALAALGLDAALAGISRRLAAILAAACGALALACGAAFLLVDAASGEALIAFVSDAVVTHYRPRFPNASADLVRTVLGPNAEPALRHLAHNLRHGTIAFTAAAAFAWALGAAAGRAALLRGLAVVAVAATTVELLVLAGASNHNVAREHPLGTPVHEFLRHERDRHAAEGGITVMRAVPGPGPELPVQLPPCTLVPERIRDLNIYTFVDGRSHLPFVELYGPDQMVRNYWPLAFPDDERLGRPLFDLLGARYVLADRPLQHAGREVGPQWRGPGGKSFHVYERAHALPRAFFVPHARVLPDDAAILRALVAPDLDPRAAVLVAASDADPTWPATARGDANGSDGTAASRSVRFVHDVPNDVVLHVEPGPAGFVVLADSFMSGWTATVNGQPAPIVRGNLCMRAVAVSVEGAEVRFSYRTPGLHAGLALTAVGLLLAMLAAVRLLVRPTRRSAEADAWSANV